MRKIVYIGFTFEHHKGTHAGYQQIKNYLKYDYIIDCQKFQDKGHKPVSEISWFAKKKRILYNRLFHIPALPWYIIKVIILGLFYNDLTFHFIYGENLYFKFIRRIVRKGNIIVCTYHQPLEWFKSEKRELARLKSVDRIILVGNTEIEDFKKIVGHKNVFYIPHGICSDFYRPDKTIKKNHMLLTVGNWLRDYDFANDVYQELLKMDAQLEINVVCNENLQKKIIPSDRIHLLNGISDEQLKELYCKCSILFLPLIRYTANNSLLEAGATGCNILISSDYPDNSYISVDYINLIPMKLNDTVLKVKNIINRNYNENLSRFVHDNYSWSVVALHTKDILLMI